MAGAVASTAENGARLAIAVTMALAALCLFLPAHGQQAAPTEWDQTIGDGKSSGAFAVAATPDQGSIVAGRITTSDASQPDAWIAKLDSGGKVQWERRFGGKEHDQANAVAATPDGGYLLAGSTRSKGKGANDGWLIKLDAKGELEWEKLFGGKRDDALKAIALVPGSGYLVAGHTRSKSTRQDGWLIKIDSAGRALWERTPGDKPVNQFNTVIPDGAGGYLLAGEQADLKAGKGNAWLVKVGAAGGLLWEKAFAEKSVGVFNSLAAAPGGGFLVAGSLTEEGSKNSDAWLVRVDADGNVVWDQRYGGKNADLANAVVTAPDGRIVLGGSTASDGGSTDDAWAVWAKSDGTQIGERRFGGDGTQHGFALTADFNGGFLLAGITAAGNRDAAIKGPTKARVYRFQAQSGTASGVQQSSAIAASGIPWYWFAVATTLLFGIALAVALLLTRRSRPITRPTEQLDMSVVSQYASELPASQRPDAAASGASGWRLEGGGQGEQEVVFEFSSLDLARAGDGLVLGRNPDLCDMTVGNSSVSRRHIRFTLLDGAIRVEDLNSTNGTYLGGQRMPPMRPTPVHNGDTLLLGDFTLTFKTMA